MSLAKPADPTAQPAMVARLRRIALPALPLLLFAGCVAVYARTAAPSVMGGDSAEFQMAAPLLGIPHPTTYPLYILLGKLFTILLPVGDLAWRVTMVSACGAALAVALLALVVRRLAGGSALAGTLGGLALAVAPGLWNAATMAEVYGLLAGLLAAAWLALLALEGGQRWQPLALAALAGLGFAHHGLFVFGMLPVVGIVLLVHSLAGKPDPLVWLRRCLGYALAFACGLLPWLLPVVQFARFGPFTGEDYGLPRHYFWGAPASWPDALGMLTGGPMRQGVFRLPTPEGALAVLQLVAERMLFEFGWLGLGLAMLGWLLLFRRGWRFWLPPLLIWLGVLLYMLLLGPAVQDAPIFTLPMLLPVAAWIGVGGGALAGLAGRSLRRFGERPAWAGQQGLLVLLVLATLLWGQTRLIYANKRHLNIWREWGQATLAELPPNAVVLAHWEQGMVLHYLVQAEQQRTDLWIDVVEPTDDAWGPRASRRYPGRPVFLVGSPADTNGMTTRLVHADSYANLYQLDTTP